MKKASPSLLILILLVVFSSSCSKINNGGSWTFKGRNYNAMGCDAFDGYGLNVVTNGSLSAGTSTNPDNSLTVTFAYKFFPHSNGTYIVANDTSSVIDSDQVSIGLELGYNSHTGAPGIYYTSTGGNGNQKVQVSVSGSGAVSVSGSGIVMKNDTLASDSAILDFNITETSPR